MLLHSLGKETSERGRPRIEIQQSRTLVCYKRGDEKRQLVRLILIGIVVGLKAVAQQMTIADTCPEHPEKVLFLNEKGRKRVKKWC